MNEKFISLKIDNREVLISLSKIILILDSPRGVNITLITDGGDLRHSISVQNTMEEIKQKLGI